ncbi:MAG TPA: hypothetical protein VGZ93_06970 [Candidatus Methylacidiphilales bacterium]|jgi:uncharacterized protein YjeT (DUF2065 family)|nr:hypothetical protein [Candidatus Methylacidiphilales bacterium]
MTYFVSLKITAIIVGLLCLAGHLPGALAPGKFAPLLKAMPRNYPLGVVLTLSAALWFATLTGVMDLGEISGMRTELMAVWVAAGVLLVIFVPGFLAARGLGCLLLLGAAVIFDAAFLVETPWRFVMTLLAYYWVIAGMALVYSPHLWRDAINYATRTPQRLRLFSWPGVVFGAVLIALGIFVYP